MAPPMLLILKANYTPLVYIMYVMRPMSLAGPVRPVLAMGLYLAPTSRRSPLRRPKVAYFRGSYDAVPDLSLRRHALGGPAPDYVIAAGLVDLDQGCLPGLPRGCYQAGSQAGEGIQDQIARL